MRQHSLRPWNGLVAGLVVLTLAIGPRAGSNPATAADISVGPNIIAPATEPFGANIQTSDYLPWDATSLTFNNWTNDSGMEPIIFRYKGTATGGDAQTIVNDQGPTTSIWNSISDGWFDSAQVRVYRVTGSQAQLLRTDTVAHYYASQTNGYKIILANSGPAVQAGDIYILSMVSADAPVNDLNPRLAFLKSAGTWTAQPDITRTLVTHDLTTQAPVNGGLSSLKVTATQAIMSGVSQPNAGSPADGDNAYTAGVTYTLDLWMKQSGIGGNGRVMFGMTQYPAIQQNFSVTDQWQEFTYSFTGPAPLPTHTLSAIQLAFLGPGTLWLDNVRLYDAGQAPYAIQPQVVQALTAYHPGSLRIWSGQTDGAWGTTLDNWISPEGQELRLWATSGGPHASPLLSLPTALTLAKQVGAGEPWLIVSPSFDETEWQNLIEYLAGPSTSPYGAKRAATGQVAPWTDVFPHIRIEYGNETWNTMFAPWTFDNGRQYGAFAEHFFQTAKSSPWYAAVAGKIDFVLGGFFVQPTQYGYGQQAKLTSPSAGLMATAVYNEGYLQLIFQARSLTDQFQNTLYFTPWVVQYMASTAAATRNAMAGQGYTYTLAAYEGGPDYSIPSPGQPYSPTLETLGKSLAAGTATLDSYLTNRANGYGPQNYFTFAPGNNWASHTAFQNGYRPHPSWLALQMCNLYCQGDMLGTTFNSGPTTDLHALNWGGNQIPDQPNAPLIGSYAFHQGGQYVVVVLSRLLSGATPVTLHLPVVMKKKGTLYTLTGDPEANNLTSLQIQIKRRALGNLQQNYTFTLPAGSVYLFVFRSTSGH